MNTARKTLLIIYGFISLICWLAVRTGYAMPAWIGCTIFAACLFFAFTPRK